MVERERRWEPSQVSQKNGGGQRVDDGSGGWWECLLIRAVRQGVQRIPCWWALERCSQQVCVGRSVLRGPIHASGCSGCSGCSV